ncbi:MAG: viroplasmin family protein, partial [Anaerolineae bacterium]|nr:viroplasmin family protein [Gloeobacterales cyanobacterium ES-bin-313]
AEELTGYEAHTTNNRMEMQAVIEGLRRVGAGQPVRVLTDSQYVIKGITEWLPGWKRRGWITAGGKPVENRDLWEALEPLAGKWVQWEHVRGHAGHPENERANDLAQAVARKQSPPGTNMVVANFESSPTTTATGRANGTTYLSLVQGKLVRQATWNECQMRVQGVSGAKFKKCRSYTEELAAITAWGLQPAALLELEN